MSLQKQELEEFISSHKNNKKPVADGKNSFKCRKNLFAV
jgi:hypothetical protein